MLNRSTTQYIDVSYGHHCLLNIRINLDRRIRKMITSKEYDYFDKKK